MVLKEDVAGLKADNKVLKEDVAGLKADNKVLKEDGVGLKEDVAALKADNTRLKSDMTALKLTLENDTNKGINIIAEGHLDLTRKLDKALEIENEKEMLKLRVNRLESEMEKVKVKLGEIA